MNISPNILTPDSPQTLMQRFVRAIQWCLTKQIPFALFSRPGSMDMRLMASSADDISDYHAFDVDDDGNESVDLSKDCFFIGRFGGDEEYVTGIRDEMSLDEIIRKGESAEQPVTDAAISPVSRSTRRINYHRAFMEMTKRLKKSGGKVVLSRVEALLLEGSIIDNFRKLHAAYHDCFRYLCYTPSTGVWIGATPELLLETRTDNPETFFTMALAGTMSADDSVAWDEKNIYEQSLVTSTIVGKLEEAGLIVSQDGPADLVVGKIRHLLTRIEGRGNADPLEILKALNPTPATLGYPEAPAYCEIDMLETHNRYCYAGAVGVVSDGELHAYVNLRCAFAARMPLTSDPARSTWLYNFYAGGGLTAASDENVEWEETGMKIASTRSLFSQQTVDKEYSIPDYIINKANNSPE